MISGVRKIKASVIVSVLLGILLACLPVTTVAAAVNPAPAAKVSFTFDDGLASALTAAAPTLQRYGMQGTSYVTTNCVGSVSTCPADPSAKYMNWNQVKQLKSAYGWEIGAHTMNHKPLSTLSNSQKEREISGSKQALTSQGINATSFATPEGDYDQRSIELIAKYFTSHRGFHDQGLNTWPYSDYLIRVQQVQVGVPVSQVRAAIDQAIASNQWVVLMFHDIQATPNSNPKEYEYATADLDRIASYVHAKRSAGLIKPTRVSDSLVTNSTSLITNGSFAAGIASGWTTDAPSSVVADMGGFGSFPEPTRAVKFTAGAANAHLFSPRVSVTNTTQYLFKNYLTVRQIVGGEIGFFIDEYDANGNWVSGQWKGAERSRFAQSFNFVYQPSSIAVAKASLQIYATGGSSVTAYLDTVQMFALQQVAPPPTNLVANGTFDHGISDGWSTDNAASVVAVGTGKGSPANQTNAVSMAANGGNAHLFSPTVPVSATANYWLSVYCSVTALASGEVGLYIDEYDANGNWVSGQWKTARSTLGASELTVQYRPTSENVRQARLQIYAAGSGVLAYVDDAKWYLVP